MYVWCHKRTMGWRGVATLLTPYTALVTTVNLTPTVALKSSIQWQKACGFHPGFSVTYENVHQLAPCLIPPPAPDPAATHLHWLVACLTATTD